MEVRGSSGGITPLCSGWCCPSGLHGQSPASQWSRYGWKIRKCALQSGNSWKEYLSVKLPSLWEVCWWWVPEAIILPFPGQVIEPLCPHCLLRLQVTDPQVVSVKLWNSYHNSVQCTEQCTVVAYTVHCSADDVWCAVRLEPKHSLWLAQVLANMESNWFRSSTFYMFHSMY